MKTTTSFSAPSLFVLTHTKLAFLALLALKVLSVPNKDIQEPILSKEQILSTLILALEEKKKAT